MELSLILLTLSLMLCKTQATEPGIKSRLTLKGLQYGWQVGLEEMHQQLKTIEIPEVKGSVSAAVLGRIYYRVSKLKIQNLNLLSSDISFSSDTGVNVFIDKGQIQVTGLLRIQTVLFSASSWLELSVQGLTLNGTLGITCDDDGHGAVWNAGCTSNAGNVNLWFHGGAGWLFDMFKGAIMGPIHDALHNQICPTFSKTVVRLEEILSNFPVSLSVDEAALFEISLLGPPLITEDNFDLLLKGEFVGRSHQWDLPSTPEKLILPDVDSHMLLLALSEYTANSATFVHYKAGVLKINITDDMIPKQSPLHLKVKNLAVFAPELPSHFPDSLSIVLQVSAVSAPNVSCQQDSLTVQGSADIQAFVVYPNKTQLPVFQMQANSVTAVNIILSEENLGATIYVKNATLVTQLFQNVIDLSNSTLGPRKGVTTVYHSSPAPTLFNINLELHAQNVIEANTRRTQCCSILPNLMPNMDYLQKTLSFGLKIMTPLLNERLKKIFQLPTPLVHLQDPIVRVLKGYVLIMTDLQMTSLSHYKMKSGNQLYSERFTKL